MPKNIVILLDGTSNEICSNRTNILRLFGTLQKGPEQVVYYSPGVGTFGAANAWSYWVRKAIELWGMATGWGLDQVVKEAYRFVIDHYDNGNRTGGESVGRDRIYIFGFSRGAYSARVLAGFINALGLVAKDNLNLIDPAYRAYKSVTESGDVQAEWQEMNLYDRILAPDHPPIRCLGVFDTVASVIEIGRYRPRFRSHACTSENPSVEAVRHAVAMDERRNLFQPLLWVMGQSYFGDRFGQVALGPQDARELWFAGVHGDVGGGFPEQQSALAKVPLDWMIRETTPMGLIYKTETVEDLVLGENASNKPVNKYVAPDPLAAANQSMNWAWGLLEFLPRWIPRNERPWRRDVLGFYLPLFSRRRISDDAILHVSVQQRAAVEGPSPNAPDKPIYQA